MQIVALHWYLDRTHDPVNPPTAQRLSAVLEALASCRQLQAVLLDGGRDRIATELPPVRSELSALSRLELHNCCFADTLPLLPALQQLVITDLDVPPQGLPDLSLQTALTALHTDRPGFGQHAPPPALRLLSLIPLPTYESPGPDELDKQEVGELAAALQRTPQLQHMAIARQLGWFCNAQGPHITREVPPALAAALDGLANLRSLHLIDCGLDVWPTLSRLSQATSFSCTGGNFVTFPPQVGRSAMKIQNQEHKSVHPCICGLE